MDDPTRDAAAVQALLERLNTQRLPRVIRLRDKVDNGARLDEYDLKFLKNVLEDTEEAKQIMADHEELEALVAHLYGLYHHITTQALQNEKAG